MTTQAKDWAKDNLVGERKMSDGSEYSISNGAVRKYLSESATDKSENLGVHISVLMKLPEIIDASIDAELHPDYKKGADGVRRAENGVGNPNLLVHRMYGAAYVDGTTYRVKVTMREYAPNVVESTTPHSFEVTKIEVLEKSNTSNGAQDAAPAKGKIGPLEATKLLKNV